MSKIDWDRQQDEMVWRGETDPPGSFVAEDFRDGKRPAKRILALVNEPMQEVSDE